MAQATISLGDGAPSELVAVVGARSYDRGLEYARRGRVLRLGWDSEAEALTGAVVGRGGLYETAAFFGPGPDGMLLFEDGRCTCPVGLNCKHVAALVLTASQRRIARPTAEPRRPSWEQPLRALIEQPAVAAVGEPLAVELALVAPHGAAPRLDARLLRPGARGGWVNGSLTWTLDDWHIRNDELRKDHLALARELHALQRAGVSQATYWYGYRGDKTIDLSGCGPHLWLLLDEAARLGLALVSADRVHGELPRYAHGEVVLDVTSPDETGLLVRALLQADGHELEPVLFLGKDGHGVVCVEPGTGSLRLVRLSRGVPPRLQRLVLDAEPLAIPAADVSRFAEELSPALARLAPVVSSDASFAPPEVSPPSLALHARFAPGHAVEIGWAWSYRVGETVHSAPLESPAGAPGFRDLPAERALLADLDLMGTGLEGFGLLDGSGRPGANGPVLLAGIESMRFTCELLPLLRAVAGIEVEVEGEPPDYRDVGESLAIGISTSEVTGERDWFDLGVSITVEGRNVPFAEVFTALAAGQSHLLLADGAHFSLLDPALAIPAPADRGGRRAHGCARRLAEDQPLPGDALVGAGRPRRRDRAGPGLAATGRCAARARRARRPRTARDARGRAPALPA